MEMIAWFIILRNFYNPIRGKNDRVSRKNINMDE